MGDLLQLLALLAAAAVLGVGALVGALVLTVRRVRRQLRRVLRPSPSALALPPVALGRLALATRSARARLDRPGPRRDAAGLCLALARARDETAACLAGAATGGPVGLAELRPLEQRLAAGFRELEARLAACAREHQPQRRAAAVAAVRPEVLALVEAAAEFRAAVRALEAETSRPRTTGLATELEEHAARLRAVAGAHRELREGPAALSS